MKSFLALLSLVATAGFSSIAIAEIAGMPVPTEMTVEAVLSAFTVAGVLMLLAGDYSRRRPSLELPSRARLMPASEVFTSASAGVRPFRQVRRLKAYV
jgi:hypothetical protein